MMIPSEEVAARSEVSFFLSIPPWLCVFYIFFFDMKSPPSPFPPCPDEYELVVRRNVSPHIRLLPSPKFPVWFSFLTQAGSPPPQ